MTVLAKFANYDWSSHSPRPLDPALNSAIVAIANILFPTGFDVADVAPDTYDKLRAHLDAGHRMLVWSGASEFTVFGCREVNWAYRAWHDWCHWQGTHDFTLEGEAATAEMQSQQLFALYGVTSKTRYWQRIIHADIVAQGQYAAEFGDFPVDQRAFVINSLLRFSASSAALAA